MGILAAKVARLQGASKSDVVGFERRTEMGQKSASLTLEYFISLMQRWRFDEYALMPRKKVYCPDYQVRSPLEAWEYSTSKVVMIPPIPSDIVQEAFRFMKAERVLTQKGIAFRNNHYHVRDAAHVYSPGNKGKKYKIRFDPSDIRQIEFYDEFNDAWQLLPNKNEEALHISFDEDYRLRTAGKLPPEAYDQSALNTYENELEAHRVGQKNLRERSRLEKQVKTKLQNQHKESSPIVFEEIQRPDELLEIDLEHKGNRL